MGAGLVSEQDVVAWLEKLRDNEMLDFCEHLPPELRSSLKYHLQEYELICASCREPAEDYEE